jgi:hypothetical protein
MREDKTARSEHALRRFAKVEKWWWGKVNIVVKKYEVFHKEIR